jgi:alpha-L-arabinofuranosidase
MQTSQVDRRRFVQALGMVGAGIGWAGLRAADAAEDVAPATLEIDPTPKFDLSPYLYIQFMEPLGVTDGSVAAAWDALGERWRPDVVEATRMLAPALMRWGGCFASYYRWKEGVGPRSARRPMLNLQWGGTESNQVGSVEFVDFCRAVKSDPLICVNFESDGRKHWAKLSNGDVRSGGPEEAAEWVAYCNDAQNALRRQHGIPQPPRVKLWQIGNETSYDERGFDLDTAARRTVAFAKAMRQADPTISLIGWGDLGWARRMAEIAGEHLQYLAFHHMFDPDEGHKDAVLYGIEYRKDPARTWQRLMDAWKPHDARIRAMREEAKGLQIPLAMTECHFALPGRNRGDVLATWAAGVANARLLNVHERHGDVLKIATAADFCGTRWQVNALMIPVPDGQSYLMPVGLVMSLYRKHSGQKACSVAKPPEPLDVTASRTGNRFFLHVVNTDRTRSVSARIAIGGRSPGDGKVFTLAANPAAEVIESDPNVVRLTETPLPHGGSWTFPAASVSAVEFALSAPGQPASAAMRSRSIP